MNRASGYFAASKNSAERNSSATLSHCIESERTWIITATVVSRDARDHHQLAVELRELTVPPEKTEMSDAEINPAGVPVDRVEIGRAGGPPTEKAPATGKHGVDGSRESFPDGQLCDEK